MSSAEFGHFDPVQFLQGFSPDKLIAQLEKIANNKSQALCLGKTDDYGKRIRLVNSEDMEEVKKEVKAGAVVKALQLLSQQIEDGKFIFEEHLKTNGIRAYAPKAIADRIEKKELALKDKSGQVHEYDSVQPIGEEELLSIVKDVKQMLKLDAMEPKAEIEQPKKEEEKEEKVEEPKTEIEQPKAEIAKTEQPKKPKAESAKAEQPKPKKQKPKEAKAEETKTEESKPTQEPAQEPEPTVKPVKKEPEKKAEEVPKTASQAEPEAVPENKDTDTVE